MSNTAIGVTRSGEPTPMTLGDVLRYIQRSRAQVEIWLRHPHKAPVPFPAPVVVGKNRYWDRKTIYQWQLDYKQYRSDVNRRAKLRLP